MDTRALPHARAPLCDSDERERGQRVVLVVVVIPFCDPQTARMGTLGPPRAPRAVLPARVHDVWRRGLDDRDRAERRRARGRSCALGTRAQPAADDRRAGRQPSLLRLVPRRQVSLRASPSFSFPFTENQNSSHLFFSCFPVLTLLCEKKKN